MRLRAYQNIQVRSSWPSRGFVAKNLTFKDKCLETWWNPSIFCCVILKCLASITEKEYFTKWRVDFWHVITYSLIGYFSIVTSRSWLCPSQKGGKCQSSRPQNPLNSWPLVCSSFFFTTTLAASYLQSRLWKNMERLWNEPSAHISFLCLCCCTDVRSTCHTYSKALKKTKNHH